MLQMRLRFKPQLHFVALISVRGTFFLFLIMNNKKRKISPMQSVLIIEWTGWCQHISYCSRENVYTDFRENYIHDPIVCPRCPARVRRTCPARGPWRCAQIHPRRGQHPHQTPPSAVSLIPLSASLAWTWWLQRCLDTNAVKDIKIGLSIFNSNQLTAVKAKGVVVQTAFRTLSTFQVFPPCFPSLASFPCILVLRCLFFWSVTSHLNPNLDVRAFSW